MDSTNLDLLTINQYFSARIEHEEMYLSKLKVIAKILDKPQAESRVTHL